MFNIQHTANTLVGDAFIRGVSGGERKRVSIAEMMATRAHVTCWDNSTRGLDASTAVRCLTLLFISVSHINHSPTTSWTMSRVCASLLIY